MSKHTNSRHKEIGLITSAKRRITNDAGLLPTVDGRSTWARRLRSLVNQHVADLGGFDAISIAELSIIRRACCITVELERLELRFATNNGANRWELEQYGRASSTLRRLLEATGLQRRSKDVTPDTLDYARRFARNRDAQDVEDDDGQEAAE